MSAMIRASAPLTIGGGAMLVLIVGGLFDAEHFFRGYLTGWLLCIAAALGSMGIVMMHHLTGGRWGFVLRRAGEAAAATMPYLTLGFIPIALGIGRVFPWADPSELAQSAVLRHRHIVFNASAGAIRAFFFLLIWCLMAWLLRSWSARWDATRQPRFASNLARLSAVGLVIYFITMSLAAVDWIASREPDWYSSTFGLVTVVGQSVTALCVLIIVAALKRSDARLRPLLNHDNLHALGNLLQTVVVLWAYISFAQFLIIWIGNTQEDQTWFYHRTHRGWNLVGAALIVLHFGMPFALLLFQSVKKNIGALAAVAAGVLALRVLDMLWSIAPSTSRQWPRGVHWMDLVGIVALGGLWFACFSWQLARAPLVPATYDEELGTDEVFEVNDNVPDAATT